MPDNETLTTIVKPTNSNVRPDSGEVYLSDAWADEQIHWEGDDWNEQGTNLYGCFKCVRIASVQANAYMTTYKTAFLAGNCTFSRSNILILKCS